MLSSCNDDSLLESNSDTPEQKQEKMSIMSFEKSEDMYSTMSYLAGESLLSKKNWSAEHIKIHTSTLSVL